MVELGLAAFVGNKLLCGLIPLVSTQKVGLHCCLRNIKMLYPAAFGQRKAGYWRIASTLHLSELIRNGVYLRVGIEPKLVNLIGTLVGKPRCLRNGNVATYLKKTSPLVQSALKANVVDCSFRPY